MQSDTVPGAPSETTWGKVIDNRKCIGCHACTVACKQEHDIPIGVNRTYVKQVEAGTFPSVRRHFQVTRCNQCADAPCVDICPTGAMYQRSDGIVDFNRSQCIGCQGCIAACPYDAIYIDPVSSSAEKCNFCTNRIDRNLQPACVVVCPTQAIFVGNLADAKSEVASLVSREKTEVRKPHKGTGPKLFYLEANESTLNPNAAVSPVFFPQSQPKLSETSPKLGSSVKSANSSQAMPANVLSYDNNHTIPWNWIVSLYTWTKSVSTGTFLVSAGLGVFASAQGKEYELTVAALAGIFLLLTMMLLVSDLTHPLRFLFVLIRPQWRSWLVRGAFSLVGFATVLVLFLIAVAVDLEWLTTALRWIGIFIGALAGVYTAFLLAQAKGRDLWQDSGLPLHFFAQMVLAGSATLMVVSNVMNVSHDISIIYRWVLVGSLGAHLVLALTHMVVPRSTTEGVLAVHNMIWGKLRVFYWGSLTFGGGLAMFLVLIGSPTQPTAISGAVLALLGLAMYGHAYVQAGQSVPLS